MKRMSQPVQRIEKKLVVVVGWKVPIGHQLPANGCGRHRGNGRLRTRNAQLRHAIGE